MGSFVGRCSHMLSSSHVARAPLSNGNTKRSKIQQPEMQDLQIVMLLQLANVKKRKGHDCLYMTLDSSSDSLRTFMRHSTNPVRDYNFTDDGQYSYKKTKLSDTKNIKNYRGFISLPP